MKWSMLVISMSFVSMAGCKKDPVPTPVPEKESIVVPSANPSASASAKLAIPLPESNAPKEIPTLVPETFSFQNGKPEGIYLMDDGTLAVTEKLKVGRVIDDKIEWLDKEVPETNPQYGGSRIFWVGGYWPQAVDVMYKSNFGRALQPTFYPLTGKGMTMVYGEGGGMGDILGVARLGESTLIAGVELFGPSFATVRGPGVIRARKLFGEGGCKKEELDFHPLNMEQYPAIVTRGFGSTRAGTVISVGMLCTTRNGGLEVWEKDKQLSKLIDLGPSVKNVDYYSAQVVSPQGDEAWIRLNWEDLIRYVDGRTEPLPKLADGFSHIFMSADHKLHVSNPTGIHRWDDDHWTQVARFAWREDYPEYMFVDTQGRFWRNAWSVRIMREGKSVEMHDGCETPFIHVYDVSTENKPDFSFPTTRKALASFPEVADLTLVDFNQDKRRLGIIVKSKAQGEAVINFLATAMPKEKPRLICYAPKDPRKIEIQAKGK